MTARRFVFLDRDGTIILKHDYQSDADLVELLPGAAAGLRRMRELGLGLVVVSNQSGVARGYFTAPSVEQVHQRLRELLAVEGVVLDAIYYCPHGPDDACACRKPAAGMIQRAQREQSADPGRSFVVGDNACDLDLARAVGARSILVRTGYGREIEAQGAPPADAVADDLAAAAEQIGRWLDSECRPGGGR